MISAPSAAAVCRYTLVEMSRRRLLWILVGLAVALIIAVGLVPLVFPNLFGNNQQERTTFFFATTGTAIGPFALIATLSIGATILYHDLESGAAVSIFAKPLSRLDYTLGKVTAAALALVAVIGAMEICSYLLLLLNGGEHQVAALGFYASEIANAFLLLLVVLILSTLINNIAAAIVGFIAVQVASFISGIHLLVVFGILTAEPWVTIVNIVYWVLPHSISTYFGDNPTGAPGIVRGPTGRVVSTASLYSGWGDLAFWAAYCVVLIALLYLTVRRKQV